MPENTTHSIPGWNRPAWAIRGVKDGPELVWQREASQDVTYTTDGVLEENYIPELIRVDEVVIDETSAAVSVGQVVIQHAAGSTIEPAQAHLLAAALVELADYAEGLR
jgi:hypothetical protein